MGRPCGQLIGHDVAASARSSQSIFAGSSRILILIAARQAMDAAMARRRSSSDARRSSRSEISRISNSTFSTSAGADSRRRRFHRDGAVAERLGFKSQGVQFIGDARIFDLLRRAEADHQGHQQTLRFDAAVRARGQHLLEQNPLMRDVLIDDPQPVAPRGDDEAVVNLAQRPQIASAHRDFPAPAWIAPGNRAMVSGIAAAGRASRRSEKSNRGAGEGGRCSVNSGSAAGCPAASARR